MIKKCLFPVAGYGTRFLPASKAIPKEMFPILTKPLIEYGVDEAKEAGCNTMAMVTSKYKKAIEDHFDSHSDIERSIKGSSKEELLKDLNTTINNTNFCYIRQKSMRGLGDAILTGEPLIGNEPFAVVLPDDLCYNKDDGVLEQMSKLYSKYRCTIVAIEEIPKDMTNRYGVIDGSLVDGRNDLYRVSDMVEKPDPKDAPTNLAIIGRYILTPDIFDIIKSTKPGVGGEIQITDAILEQAKKGNVLAYKFKGKRFDCGQVDGFVEATNFFYSKAKKD
jgi:UTP--glucose-1-phosphate uridylyltransferase